MYSYQNKTKMAFTALSSTFTVLSSISMGNPNLFPIIHQPVYEIKTYNDGMGVAQNKCNNTNNTFYLTSYKSGLSMNNEVVENLNKIDSFAKIKDTDFIGVDNTVKEKMSSLFLMLSKQPEIFAIGDGSIQMEYGNARNRYLEFVILPNNKMEFLRKDGDEIFENINIDYDPYFIVKEVKNFYE